MKPAAEKLTELIGVKFTGAEAAYIERMAQDGGFGSRGALIRSIIREIIKDEIASSEAAVGG